MWPSWLKWLFSAWVALDSKRRQGVSLLWTFLVLICGPLLIPIYLYRRPLLQGEVRRGSFLWNVLCNFEKFFSAILVFAGFAVLAQNLEESFSDADIPVVKRAEIQAGSIFGLFVLLLLFGLERVVVSLFRYWFERDMPIQK